MTTFSQESALFMFTCEKDQAGYKLHHPVLLSNFIESSSVSDPHFISPDSLLVICSDDKRSDIYLMSLNFLTVLRVTGTPDLEYSPQKKPGEPYFSCLVRDSMRFEPGRLWIYPYNLKNGGREVYSCPEPILSYCWLGDSLVAVVIGDNVPELHLIGMDALSEQLISGKVTSSIKKDGNGNLFYLYQYDQLHHFIKKVDPETLETQIVKKGPAGGDVLGIVGQDNIIMGAENKIFILNRDTNEWDELADLSKLGIEKVTELAFNGVDKVVVAGILER